MCSSHIYPEKINLSKIAFYLTDTENIFTELLDCGYIYCVHAKIRIHSDMEYVELYLYT